MNPLWTFPLTLPDLGAIAGLVVALFGLATNTFQLRVLVRQIRLDTLIRIADSSRRFAVIAIERPELWEAMQIAEPRSGHEGFRRDRFIQLWLNHVVVVWKCWRSGMLDADDWEACCRDIEAVLALPAVREEWLRVRDYYPRPFQHDLAELSHGALTPASHP